MKIKDIVKDTIKKILSNNIVQFIISKLISCYMYIVYFTSKIKIIGYSEDYKKFLKSGNSSIIMTWHGRVFILPPVFKNFFFEEIKLKKNVCVLSSKHKDGKLAATVSKNFGFKQIFGSSINKKRENCVEKSGAVKSIIVMMKEIKNGSVIFLAPDGPRGPANKINSEIVNIAKKHNTTIFTLAISYSRKKEINSWDKFQVPLPFGKIVVEFLEPLTILKSSSFEESNLILEKRMNKIFENDNKLYKKLI